MPRISGGAEPLVRQWVQTQGSHSPGYETEGKLLHLSKLPVTMLTTIPRLKGLVSGKYLA